MIAVPTEISGPGSIVRRQTTYWEVRGANDTVYRVHFRDKVEAVFASADYTAIAAGFIGPDEAVRRIQALAAAYLTVQ